MKKARRYLIKGRKTKIQFPKEKKTKEVKRNKEAKKRQDDDIRIHDRPLHATEVITKMKMKNKLILCLPRKFVLYEEVKVSKYEAEIEKCIAKLRSNRWKEEEGANIREYAFNIDDVTIQ